MPNDLEFSINLEGFEEHIKSINAAEGKLNDLKEPLEVISKYMLRRIYRGFKSSEDPYGNEWEEVTELTMRTRKKNTKNEKPLIDTGALRNSFNAHIEDSMLTIGSNNKYADIHQYGGTSENGADIPQRIMLPIEDMGLPDLWRNKALRELTNHILKE